MEDFVKMNQKISSELIAKEMKSWTIHNSSEETDSEKWEQGIKDFSKVNGKTLVEIVENIGKL